MSKYRNKQQWLELITECRQSGMSDMDWCRANGIAHSTFYNAIARLRKSSCELPESIKSTSNQFDLTSHVKPDIVPVSIISDIPSVSDTHKPVLSPYTIKIVMGDMTIRVSNDADSSLLMQVLRTLGGMS